MEAVLNQFRTLYLIMHIYLILVTIYFNDVDKDLTSIVFQINLFGTGFCRAVMFLLKLS